MRRPGSSRIRDFVRKYVEVDEEFELISVYYVLFTWVYDAFHEVPFVRVRGGYGSGKRGFLTADTFAASRYSPRRRG